ncbi:D-lactate dehydrogenase LDHD [Acrasis kona]|uniref:D-lactate dehydrogenase (cytochrome) n=1 Tax=Acrasis kona TaxID=1008807 RepID=A0AAW2ZFC7_9EUKA
MNKVVKINKDDMDVTVQPGITYDELNEALKDTGLFFPMDPGPGACIGGMVGTSCSGTHAVRYGTMKENVLNLKVVLPDGTLVKTANRAKKSSAGYDLTHLFVGSEGTLGIVSEITLRLKIRPQKTAVSVTTFPSNHHAAQTVIETMKSGVQIGRAELLDEVMIKAVNQNSDLELKEAPTLFFEFSGTDKQVDEQIAIVKDIVNNNKGQGFKFAVDVDERERLWTARKIALWSAPILKPESDVWITDVCVPISKLADCIQETKDDLDKSFLLAPMVSHAGDGNFHLFILFNSKDKKESDEAKRINTRLVERAIKMEGTCTGEHGVGVGKRAYLEKELGPGAIKLMRTIKKAVDPHNLFNPGKIIPDEQGHNKEADKEVEKESQSKPK